MKIKCPVCKSTKEFEKVDIDCMHHKTYVKGFYVYLYRCKKCNIVIARDNEIVEEELK